MQKLLSLVQLGDVIELNVGIFDEDFFLNHVDKVSVRADAIWIDVLRIRSSLFLFLFLWNKPGFVVVSASVIFGLRSLRNCRSA